MAFEDILAFVFAPWRRIRQLEAEIQNARQLKAVAEENAIFLQSLVIRIQDIVEKAHEEEVRALKIAANIGHQVAYGMVPFPEAAALPKRTSEAEVRSLQEMYAGEVDERRQANDAFRESETAYAEQFFRDEETGTEVEAG